MLSSIEGLNVATDVFKPYVLPIAVAIPVGLFALQPLGTARLGRYFGPVVLVWFAVIASIGAVAIARSPGVLVAFDPLRGLAFLVHHGRRPVRVPWTGIVLPALLLNYAGQAAQLVRDPKLASNPFFSEVPHWGVYPLVGIATCGLAPLAEGGDQVLADLRSGALPRIAGSAVFLSRTNQKVPPLMARHIALFGALPERPMSLSVKFEQVARVPREQRVTVTKVMENSGSSRSGSASSRSRT